MTEVLRQAHDGGRLSGTSAHQSGTPKALQVPRQCVASGSHVSMSQHTEPDCGKELKLCNLAREEGSQQAAVGPRSEL